MCGLADLAGLKPSPDDRPTAETAVAWLFPCFQATLGGFPASRRKGLQRFPSRCGQKKLVKFLELFNHSSSKECQGITVCFLVRSTGYVPGWPPTLPTEMKLHLKFGVKWIR